MSETKLLKYRRFNQFYAWLLSYFWLPCPLCGEMFGGHEVGEAVVWRSEHSGQLTCYRHLPEESIGFRKNS